MQTPIPVIRRPNPSNNPKSKFRGFDICKVYLANKNAKAVIGTINAYIIYVILANL